MGISVFKKVAEFNRLVYNLGKDYSIKLQGEAYMNEQVQDVMLNTHEKRLENHEGRIDLIENRQITADVQMGNVCKELRLYAKATFWFIGIIVVAMLGMLTFCVEYIVTH